MRVKIFGYKIEEERPIDELFTNPQFYNHRRLEVFAMKGTSCVSCNRVGTRLIRGSIRGQDHWDVYTDDLIPITVDHIIPRSKGGADELFNKQPMCSPCNAKKGNK
jgi:5-methylcytosine-specific restriction endonuclease McrA